MMRAARFCGGPWNAATMEVDTGAVTIKASNQVAAHAFIATRVGTPERYLPRLGTYRQNAAHPHRFDWEGWDDER